MKKTEQKIGFYRNIFTLFFTAFFILGGGLCSIYLFNREILSSIDNLILFYLGIIFEIGIVGAASYSFIRIKKLIKEL